MPINDIKSYDEVFVEGKPLGRNKNHDPRSRQYVYQSEQPITAPLHTVEHEIVLDPINQLNIGACVGFTGTAYLAFRKIYDTLPPEVKAGLGQQFAFELYSELTRHDPFPGTWRPTDTGSDGLTLAKVLKARGYISGFTHTFNAASALLALQDFPLAIGIEWLSGCDNPDSSGLIRYTGNVRGGHEVLVVGYVAEKQLVKIRNHWGANWGINGHAFISVVDFTRAIQNGGDVIILTPITKPPPEPIVTNTADSELIRVFNESYPVIDSWGKTAWSRFTKAGKAKVKWEDFKSQFDTWKIQKGY